MSTELFYQELPSFSKFTGIVDEVHFHDVPDDWTIIITDVRGSTKAIESGRYKDVNTVGAAAIACVQNVVGDRELPFVFGGDGATILVPPSQLHAVTKELLALKTLAINTFALELRVGSVKVSELTENGASIRVAKFELVPGKAVAIFRGGGVTAAEDKVKGESDTYELRDEAHPKREADLSGLSCRWRPIQNRHGKILSLLVVAQSSATDDVYTEVLSMLDTIYDGKIERANPVNIDTMQYRSFSECLHDERRYHDSRFSFGYIYRVIEILLAVLIFKFKIPPLFFNAKKYARSMATHSDYRKFDDALRMIIDCTAEQSEIIRAKLEALHVSDMIYFGLHESDTSLMTCYVNGLSEGKHIHFVDGGDGGYAIAAKQLKQQMKAGKSASAESS